MPYVGINQRQKEDSTAVKASSSNNQVNPAPARPTTLLSSDSKVLDESFLLPESDDDAELETDSEDYELTDEELLDYGRPGRRRAAEKQGPVSEPLEDEEKGKGKGVWLESFSSEVSKVKKNLRGKKTKQPGKGKQDDKTAQEKSGSSK